jgi:hypothetical protein
MHNQYVALTAIAGTKQSWCQIPNNHRQSDTHRLCNYEKTTNNNHSSLLSPPLIITVAGPRLNSEFGKKEGKIMKDKTLKIILGIIALNCTPSAPVGHSCLIA